MNIGFDAKRLFLNETGLGNYSRDLLKALMEYFPEHHYHLYTPKGEVDLKTKFLKNYTNRTIHYPTGIYKNFKSYWRSVALEKSLLQDNISVYHGLSNEIPKKGKKSNIKYVVTIHDLIFLRYPKNYKAVDRKIYQKKAKYACENSDKIIAISEQTKNDIIEFYNVPENKIEVIYQTCYEGFKQKVHFEFMENVRKKYNLPEYFILYVGTIEKRKNLATLVKAIGISGSKLPLVAIGKQTDYFKEVEKEVNNYDLGNQVAFLQNVSIFDLPAIYQMANVFVYPSFYEGFGIPIIESLYSKTPVITSKGGCFEEAGGPNSIYIDPNNAEEIAIEIDKITHDSKAQLEITEKGYEYAQKFSNENLAKRLMKVYTSL